MSLKSENSPASKISDENRINICKRFSAGETFQEISKDLPIGAGQVAYICRTWGPHNGYPYVKRIRPRKKSTRQRKPRIDLIGFENDHGVVVGLGASGYWIIECKHCAGEHSQTSREIQNNAYTRVCPEFKNWRWSGLSRQDAILRRTYGITESEYQAMRIKQNNRCAICGIKEKSDGKTLSIDHDHASNKVRGLLCAKCNHAIGLFDDKPERIERAIKYLEQHDNLV